MLFFWFYYNLKKSQARNDNDDIECINVNKVPKDYILSFHDEKHQNLSNVKIEIILYKRDIAVYKISTKNQGSKSLIKFKNPFEDFMLTDCLVLNILDSSYKLHNLEYINNGKWGAFGYLGGKCELKFEIE